MPHENARGTRSPPSHLRQHYNPLVTRSPRRPNVVCRDQRHWREAPRISVAPTVTAPVRRHREIPAASPARDTVTIPGQSDTLTRPSQAPGPSEMIRQSRAVTAASIRLGAWWGAWWPPPELDERAARRHAWPPGPTRATPQLNTVLARPGRCPGDGPRAGRRTSRKSA